MRNAGGFACITSEDGVQEADTFSCKHCQRITHVKPRQDPAELGGFCRQCYSLICKHCVGKECLPFMKWVEQVEEADYRRRAYG
jgi:hypothetical protein